MISRFDKEQKKRERIEKDDNEIQYKTRGCFFFSYRQKRAGKKIQRIVFGLAFQNTERESEINVHLQTHTHIYIH